ncbi:NACHT, LRR and PYD domains-containing protein 3 [Varanus komodoensis]|nr:NACHT, LRR and PYD domains-containing protein 3 [Varanus komodoensis]
MFSLWVLLDRRRRYQRSIQEMFGSAAKQASAPAAAVSLHHRCAELLLGRTPHPQEGSHALLSVLRTHQKAAARPEHFLEVGVENLFGPDAERKSSRTVVLLGAPGVGKTTAVRKLMLDWAAGKFGQREFQYAFYLSCRAVNCSSEPMSVADLVLGGCPPGTLLTEEDVFSDQESILFVVDGFEELECWDLRRDVPSSDLQRKQAAADLVMGLIRRKLLARCHLIVTMRPMALKALLPSLRSPQFVEVLGLCPAERRKYFHHFFENEEEATRAFELARSNETLFSMCFLPAVCWIICTIVRQKLPSGPLNDIPETATITEIYMRLLLSFLGCHSRPSDLEGLCSLAKDGTLCKMTAFSKDMLISHGLGSSGSGPLSSGRKLLHQDEHNATLFKFIHVSFQEFFAALFYLLDTDGDPARSFSDLEEVLADKKECGSPSSMLVRFLFGLCSTERLGVLQDAWGHKASRTRLWQVLLSWVSGEAECHSFRDRGRLLELCHCIYEMEDPTFAESTMAHVRDLDLREQLVTKLDFAALSYCLSSSGALQALRLSGYELGPAGAAQLLPGLLKSLEIQLNSCGLVAAMCKDLAAVVSRPTLTRLDLGDNPLGDGGITHLSAGLLDPHCKLQTLR